MKTHKFLSLPIFLLALLPNLFSQRPVGVNLAPLRDWSSEFVFKDAFKMCREWTPVNTLNGQASPGLNIPLRPDGYPQSLPIASGGSNFGVRTYVFTDATYPIPTGDFTLISDGVGTIRVRQSGGPNQTYSSPGTHAIPQATGTHFIIDILQSDAADPVRNVRFIMPGFLVSFENQPFHPDFLGFLDNFQCLRFMDWMSTNASIIEHWGQRTPLDYYTQTLWAVSLADHRGVAYEHLTNLCNTLDKNAWVNIPHMADDDYILQFAQFLKGNLKGTLKIYVEYSNEVWNTALAFEQSGWVAEQGLAMGYPAPVLNQRALFTARRSADIFRIFETVFGSEKGRLVKVLPGQAGNTAVAQTVLNAFINNIENVNPTGVGVDALAIAPYFGNFVTSANSVDDALDQAEISLGLAFQRMTNHRNLLTNQGWDIPLIAYEGGQHLNGPNAATDALFCQANRDERMGDIYCEYAHFWFDAIAAGLFMHFNSESACGNSGSWGLKEYTGQPDSEAPKFTALLACSPTDPITGASETLRHEPLLFESNPNPTTGLIQLLSLTDLQYDRAEVFDLCGRLVLASIGSGTELDFSGHPPGLYFLVLKKMGRVVWREKIIKL